jgi:transmembrane sensor
MDANREVERTLAHQASEWVTRLRRRATPAELASFAEWVKTSPRHMRDFLLMSAIERELHHIDASRRYGAHELTDEAPSNVMPLQNASADAATGRARQDGSSRGRALWTHRAVRVAGWAALAGAVALGVWQPGVLSGWKSYATATGEQRAIELEDGSIVQLNTRSRIEVRISGERRDIRLLAGEALFKVHRDPSRSFRVYTPDAAIQALGTQFNVYQRPDGTTVVVLEGKVGISPGKGGARGEERQAPAEKERVRAPATPLGAGEKAHIDAQGTIRRELSSDPASAVVWQQRRLVFQATPLSEITREFNRYNAAPKFRLDGEAVRARHYTGVFDADDPESLLELLQAEPGLTVTRSGEEILVRD